MNYSIQRAGHFYPIIDAESIGSARSLVEEVLEHEIEEAGGAGFRWIPVKATWQYQVVDARDRVLLSVAVVPDGESV